MKTTNHPDQPLRSRRPPRVPPSFPASALALLSLVPAAARGESTVNERRDVSANVQVVVRTISGSVRVAAWEKNELFVTGELDDGVERLEVLGSGDKVEVRVVPRRRSGGDAEAELVLQLPRGARLDVETVSAGIQTRELANTLVLETVSGDIEVSGRLRELTVRTVSGDVAVRSVGVRSTVKTVSGEIELSDASGELDLETVSGRIRLSGEAFSRLRARSISSEISIQGDLSQEASVDLESHSGDITLALPGSTAASFELTTFSGELTSELGPQASGKKAGGDRECARVRAVVLRVDGEETRSYVEEGEDCGDHDGDTPEDRRMSFTTGAPSPRRVAIKTFSSDVLLRKR